jgi:hypothetical protein
MSIRLTVRCGTCKEIVDVFLDKIEEKYPFWCPSCEEYCREGRFPWALTAEQAEAEEPTPASVLLGITWFAILANAMRPRPVRVTRGSAGSTS